MPTPILPAHEITLGDHPTASIIWMHGLGADGYDFAPIVKELQLPDSLSVRFVFPHAPRQPITINNGFLMPAWYDVVSFERGEEEDEAGIRESQAAIEALIRQENGRGVPTQRIVLAGFSQGGAIALQTALRHPEPLAGLMALSTYLPLQGSFAAEASEANRQLPVFMAHGSQDTVIRPDYATLSRHTLEAAGYAVEWHLYPMAHSVCMEEVAHISDYLTRVLA